jgi:crotonobetainyl-CoA:carnitine CoA-transferase CaiB-like acyl-CoA transferase
LGRKDPLEGIIVLDVTTNISGPYATHILSSLGATVWKVERIDGGDDTRQMSPTVDGQSGYFATINPFKKSVAIDLKRAKGKNVLKRLIRHADVFIENFRPGVAESLGVGWSDVHQLNRKTVYASISAYGSKGPKRLSAGYDALLQARTGLLSVTGAAGHEPIRIGVSILDMSSGMWAAVGILTALYERKLTNKAQHVTTSLFEAGVFYLGYHLASLQLTGKLPLPQGSGHQAFSPYGAFSAKGGGYILIGISNDRQFQRLSVALDHEEWLGDSRYNSNAARVTNREALRIELEAILKERPAKYWEDFLDKSDVPVARLQNTAEVLHDSQAKALSVYYPVSLPKDGSIQIPRLPIVLSSHHPPLKRSGKPPLLGEHTDEILSSVGYTRKKIRELVDSGVLYES